MFVPEFAVILYVHAPVVVKGEGLPIKKKTFLNHFDYILSGRYTDTTWH